MAVYEVVLRFQDREEVRLTDRPLEVGTTVQIGGQRWVVEGRDAERGQSVRYLCVEPRERRSAATGRGTMLRERFAAAEPE
jgi:hypothetical protein